MIMLILIARNVTLDAKLVHKPMTYAHHVKIQPDI